ncbi:MAG: isoprenylcysteine carboxylmethyltransferase family protein [Bradyrhizobiaceae bacterium]|nr:isoprenylcysteine carboxylmethyltransferase family protein [Bradyrhizobiaceae bacterium]
MAAVPESADRPHVVIWPPLLPAIAILLGFGLDWLMPLGLLEQVSRGVRGVLALVLAAIAGAIGIAGIRGFMRAGTHVEPWKPATTLVAAGIYAHTRNPMYLALGLGTLAFAITNASDWTMVLLAPAALVLHFGVVLREERYLEGKFGDAYRRYRAAVPRYGWRLRAD